MACVPCEMFAVCSLKKGEGVDSSNGRLARHDGRVMHRWTYSPWPLSSGALKFLTFSGRQRRIHFFRAALGRSEDQAP